MTARTVLKHLTEDELAERWGVTLVVVKRKRKNGVGPKYLLITESATKQTIRYRLADVEEWEQELLTDPQAKATA